MILVLFAIEEQKLHFDKMLPRDIHKESVDRTIQVLDPGGQEHVGIFVDHSFHHAYPYR